MQKIKDTWKKVTSFLTTDEFVLFFPLAVFTVTAIVLRSTLMAVVVAIWLITVCYGGKRDE
jgi:hypothetical protein